MNRNLFHPIDKQWQFKEKNEQTTKMHIKKLSDSTFDISPEHSLPIYLAAGEPIQTFQKHEQILA